MYVYVYTHTYVYTNMYVCTYIYIYSMVHNTYTLNVPKHVMDLAGGTYLSVHALVGACMVPSDS